MTEKKPLIETSPKIESIEPIAKNVPPVKTEVVIPTGKSETHEHQWDLILKNYAPPKPEFFGMEHIDPATSEKLLFGVTILLWKCVLCAETKKEEVIGTDENQLDEMLSKVLSYGPQYMQKDGVTFVLSKWQPAVTPTNNLPLR